MHTDIVNTEDSEHWLGLDDSDSWQTCGHGGYSEEICHISALEIWQPYKKLFTYKRSGYGSVKTEPGKHTLNKSQYHNVVKLNKWQYYNVLVTQR